MTPEQIASTYDAFEICIRRWMGTWLDLFVFIGAGFALASLGSRNIPLEVVLWLLLVALYYPLLEGLTGRTFGKLLCGLKVVDETGRAPGIWKAATRSLLRLVEVNPLLSGGLPAAIAIFNSRTRQRMGDASARTYVLRNEDLHRLPLPGTPAALGEFSLPGAPGDPAAQIPAAGYLAVPGMRPARLPQSRFWALPGTLLTTVAAIGLGNAAVRTGHERDHAKPPTLAVAKFLAAPPAAGWYRLTGCELALEKVQYEVKSTGAESSSATSDAASSAAESKPLTLDTIGTLYIPVFAGGQDHEQKARLLLRTDDEELKKLMAEAEGLEEGDTAKKKSWRARLSKRMLDRQLTGLVDTDPDMPQNLREQLEAGEAAALAPGYRVLHEGKHPLDDRYNGLWAAAILLGVVGAGFWLATLIALVTGGPVSPPRPYPASGYPPYPPYPPAGH